jgi:exopolyphosphatase/guanosine-5'-triphosphate,3'-diphosphate pyrophosphatase
MTELVAAVDLGSNSFHLCSGFWDGEAFTTLERVKERVRLASGLDARSELDAASIARAEACLRRFRGRLGGVSRVRAVATSAVRDARNREAFLAVAQAALGCPVDVISGEQEGRLIYLGVANVLESTAPRLVVDIGGGSTELTAGQGFGVAAVASLPVGCVTMTRRFFGGGHLGTCYEQALAHLVDVVRAARPHVAGDFAHVVGTSGTIESVQDVLRLNGWASDTITREGVERLGRHLRDCSSPMDLATSGLQPDRIDIFAAGAAILEAVFRVFDLPGAEYSSASLLDGVLYDLVGLRRAANVRESTIRTLQRRHGVDTVQAARVAGVALQWFDDVRVAWSLDDEHSRDQLRMAAALHELGLALTASHHERHGAYLVQHSEMRGFNRPQKQALAALVRAHRRAFPRLVLAAFAPAEQRRLTDLSLLLRLAVLVCTARRTVATHVTAAAGGLTLHLDDDHLRDDALLAHSLEGETAVWAAVGRTLRVTPAAGGGHATAQ